jgi:hypothetical protein
MSSREKTHRRTDMESDRQRADTLEEKELRGSQLAAISQISFESINFLYDLHGCD